PAQFCREITAICFSRLTGSQARLAWLACKGRKRTTILTREINREMGTATTIESSWNPTLICDFEVEKHRIGKPDDSSRRKRDFDITVAILSIFGFQAPGDAFSVDRCPELTDILEEKRSGDWIATDAAMLPGNVRRSIQLQIHPKTFTTATDHRLLFT